MRLVPQLRDRPLKVGLAPHLRSCVMAPSLLPGETTPGARIAGSGEGHRRWPQLFRQMLDKAGWIGMMREMPATLEQTTPAPATARLTFILRFVSTIVLWS